MQFRTPTTRSLIAAALHAARVRVELLLLLAALAGIGTSIVYAPALMVLENFIAALNEIGARDTAEQEAAEIFRDGASTLLFGHLGTTAVSTFLLIPFARASAPGELLPGGGGFRAFFIRGMRSFLHMVAVNGITMLVSLLALPLVALISTAVGPLGNLVALVAISVNIWIAIALTGTAHLAIAAEARDRRETLPSAFMRARLFLAPIAGSLALIMLVVSVLYLVLGTILVSILPDIFQPRAGLIMLGAALYLVSALHVSALYSVPDFRDLNPA